MNIRKIVDQLKAERDRLDHAISALESISPNGASSGPIGKPIIRRRVRRRLTAAGRKKLSDMMKKRWAERRKKKA